MSAKKKSQKQPAIPFSKIAITVFLCGACVMIFELLGSRIVAPYLGSSIYTWTSLIGVILCALSAGYAWGGRLADAKPEAKRLGLILILAGVGIALATVSKDFVMRWWQAVDWPLQIKILGASVVLFVFPSVCLGMVSPFGARLSLKEVASGGKAFGNISTISTLGSIVGTFMAGYWMIAYVGTTVLCYSLAVLLLVLALWWSPRKIAVLGLLAIVIAIGWVNKSYNNELEKVGFYDIDTPYTRAWIADVSQPHNPDRESLRIFEVAGSAIYSAMDPSNPDDLIPLYMKAFDQVRQNMQTLGHHDPHVLVAGGAGFIYPTWLLRNTDLRVDSVEIDPQMWQIAKEHFGASEDVRHYRYTMDIRSFLRNPQHQYDLICYDIFNDLSIPFHTITSEAFAKIKAITAADGVFTMNLVDRPTNPQLAPVVEKTAAGHFKNVVLYVYESAQDGASKAEFVNYFLIASDADLEQVAPREISFVDGSYRLINPDLAKLMVLTDNYAPVQALLHGHL